MSCLVKFLGAQSAPVVPADPSLQLWTYSVDLGSPSARAVDDLIALGFPPEADIRDPALFPDVTELSGMFLRKDDTSTRQYAGTTVRDTGLQFITLIAGGSQAPAELLLAASEPGEAWSALPFSTAASADADLGQELPAPSATGSGSGASPTGSTKADFTGTLPYASEVFGVYQPLAGWLGRKTTQRLARVDGRPLQLAEFDAAFTGRQARALATPLLSATVSQLGDQSQAVLSPIGLVSLFREYFFEFDNFLGTPSGHLWISPGGTVEMVESSTRHTLTERTSAQSDEGTYKIEETLTGQDDVADAVKEDNANDTKLGASASAGAKFAGIYQADASASFSNETTTKKSSEVTHKHTRTQSSRVSSEIKRNFQTTFKTVTETTDVSSRRYVVQNTTQKLVNYELRRKMRKVGVQVQHIGTRLSWQVFLDSPGADLGLGELVHVVPAPDVSSIRKPDPPPVLAPKETEFSVPFILQKFPGTENDPHQDANYTRSGENPTLVGMHSDDNDDHIVADFNHVAPSPGPGYMISAIRTVSAKTQGGDAQFLANYSWPPATTGGFRLEGQFLNFGGGRIITVTLAITWIPPSVDPAQAVYQSALAAYNATVSELQRKAYGEAIRERMKLVSALRRRPSEDLRKEERHTVYGKLIQDLHLMADPHVDSELIRQIFDVDEMLYFAAPEYWRPRPATIPARTAASVGRYPVPPTPTMPSTPPADPLLGETVLSWYSHTDKNNDVDPAGTAQERYRIDYLVTEDTQPAPFGSSLGWLIQIDGDDRRNEFLNAAWVKAVLPIRPGHELEALDWLAQAKVEGEAGLDQPYPVQPGDPASFQGKTLGQVLTLLATELQAANTDIGNTLATEKVFETGFDPLGSGFRPAEPYMIFDEWIEVLPTDQVVAVEVTYDPKTGKLV